MCLLPALKCASRAPGWGMLEDEETGPVGLGKGHDAMIDLVSGVIIEGTHRVPTDARCTAPLRDEPSGSAMAGKYVQAVFF
jgi:hypothetical protein